MNPPKPEKSVIRPTDADAIRLARTLVRSARFGALAVLDPASGAPIASRVALATDQRGAPLILVSALSGHTRAITADPRCSLLAGEPGKGDPLAWPRISLYCRAERLAAESAEAREAARRYLNKNAKAKLYAGFPDFAFFRLEPSGASLNGGFGKAFDLTAQDLLIPEIVPEIAEIEQSAIVHMNEHHKPAIALLAGSGKSGIPKKAAGEWFVTGIDPDGADFAAGDAASRLFFEKPVSTGLELRSTLAKMTESARKHL